MPSHLGEWKSTCRPGRQSSSPRQLTYTGSKPCFAILSPRKRPWSGRGRVGFCLRQLRSLSERHGAFVPGFSPNLVLSSMPWYVSASWQSRWRHSSWFVAICRPWHEQIALKKCRKRLCGPRSLMSATNLRTVNSSTNLSSSAALFESTWLRHSAALSTSPTWRMTALTQLSRRGSASAAPIRVPSESSSCASRSASRTASMRSRSSSTSGSSAHTSCGIELGSASPE